MLTIDFWKNKKVFLTGHTGFKGSWMSAWLLQLGAKLTGYSLGIPTTPSMFEDMNLSSEMNSIFGDIRDLEKLKKALTLAQPEVVIHMAAQPLVRYSYAEPVETYMTNVMGTVHLLEAVRASGSVRAVVNVTSDKCYENQERIAPYVESDPLCGHDPYSSSKGCAELVTSAYRKSFFDKEGIPLASGRAGNVIGGGDWATDRLLPDIIQAYSARTKLLIRSPHSVRPWQHVLEPVGGYLLLAEKMYSGDEKYAQAFNFGPSSRDHRSVLELIKKINSLVSHKIEFEIQESELHEAKLLALDCKKANSLLKWTPKWNLDTALQMTINWNDKVLAGADVRNVVLEQINVYQKAQSGLMSC